jgi:hypothetical protein
LYERVGAQEKKDTIAPGRPGRDMDISCLQWCLGNHTQSIQMMHGLAAGILDGSVKYGDAAGGMAQGLLLYYMGIAANRPEQVSFALDYMRNRVRRSFGQIWPCPVAQYYLGEVSFESLMEAVNRPAPLPGMANAAKVALGRRRRLAVALFHEGVRNRAQGDERGCLARMQECYGLEDPLLEQEWYLARYEVQKADLGPL